MLVPPAPGSIWAASNVGGLSGKNKTGHATTLRCISHTPTLLWRGKWGRRRRHVSSLVAGKLAGNLRESCLSQAVPARIGAAASKTCSKFPAPQGQGTRRAGARKFFVAGTEILDPGRKLTAAPQTRCRFPAVNGSQCRSDVDLALTGRILVAGYLKCRSWLPPASCPFPQIPTLPSPARGGG